MRWTTYGVALLALAGAIGRAADDAEDTVTVRSANGLSEVALDQRTGVATADGGVTVEYRDTTLTAQRVLVDNVHHQFVASGDVAIQRRDHTGRTVLWRGEHAEYNYETREITTDKFRFGAAPLFVSGDLLRGVSTNGVQTATNAIITTDDVSSPGYFIKARSITIGPGEKVSAQDAVMVVGGVPVMYYPTYTRDRNAEPDYWALTPGYRSTFGPFLLSQYHYVWSTNLDTHLNLDVRQSRGLAGGPGVDYDAGDLGAGRAGYYYAYDLKPGTDTNGAPIQKNRYRYYFDHQIDIGDDFNAKAVAHGQSDPYVIHDFYEGEYRRDIEPRSYLEATEFWRNFSLDAMAETQLNSFYRTVERLPDVQLTGLRQQIGNSPFYYETQNSLAYLSYRDGLLPAGTPSTNYQAFRADSLQQIVMPETFFGWLNLTPRVGGRFTHYGDPTGLTNITSPVDRWVFNTGMEMSFKASQTWPGYKSELLEMDGARHILEPTVNYAYVPRPNATPNQLPQFDTELPTYRLLPLAFPDYNDIDSVDAQNTIRWGLNDKLQTKRSGQVEDVINWQTYLDWHLQTATNAGTIVNPVTSTAPTTFSDLYNDIDFSPRKWITLTSTTRYDINARRWDELYHRVTFQPGEDWSWSVGHRYLVDNPLTYGSGNNLILSTLRYRINEDWGFRFVHQFEARVGQMQEQYYTIYRDLRSWTAALSVRRRYDPLHGTDWTIAVTFQLKAFPRFKLNQDEAVPERLFGG